MEKDAQVRPAAGTRNKKRARLPGRLLTRAFFDDAPERVAPRLLGKILVRRMEGEGGVQYMAGRIVEVEAYLGPHHDTPDPAAHSHRGRTARNAVLFGPAGHAYLYFIYGRYFCANVSCEGEGKGGGILLRALEPLHGADLMRKNRGLSSDAPEHLLASGPGRLCQAMGLTRPLHNSLDLVDRASPLQMREDGYGEAKAHTTVRIGIRHAADLPLRFILRGHPSVSGPRSLRS